MTTPSAPDPTPPNDADQPTPPLPRWAQASGGRGALLSETRLAAYFGPKWDTVYRRKLAPFLEDPAFVPTWNWSAALLSLVTPAWFLYRKLYLPFVLFFLAPPLALSLLLDGAVMPQTVSEMTKPENQGLINLVAAVQFSTALAAGGTANWLLFRRARAACRFAEAQQLPTSEEHALMVRMGGVNGVATAMVVAMSLMLTLARLRG